MGKKGFYSMVYKGKNNGRVDVPESWIGEEVIVQIIPKKLCERCGSNIPADIHEEFCGLCEECYAELNPEEAQEEYPVESWSEKL
ncbi:hypothetical protein KAU33_09085 [Candidatus Dependentiae bacterium]|nr:hypothetical protein [Candidatus Dependentiae bacterium]